MTRSLTGKVALVTGAAKGIASFVLLATTSVRLARRRRR